MAWSTLMEEMLKTQRQDLRRARRVVVSGSGNVAIYAAEKASSWARKVVAMCDSNGWIYDPERRRPRLPSRRSRKSQREPHQGVPATTAPTPSITRLHGHLDRPLRHRPALRHPERAERGTAPRRWSRTACIAVAEGANMPTTPGGHRDLPAERRALCPRQGGQRRRRGHLRAGDEPELPCA